MAELFKSGFKNNTAPGPDGLRAGFLRQTPEEMRNVLRAFYTGCLRKCWFPPVWKRALLTLIPKPGDPVDGPSRVRRICLLDDLGKGLERIVVGRMRDWMREHPEVDLAPN